MHAARRGGERTEKREREEREEGARGARRGSERECARLHPESSSRAHTHTRASWVRTRPSPPQFLSNPAGVVVAGPHSGSGILGSNTHTHTRPAPIRPTRWRVVVCSPGRTHPGHSPGSASLGTPRRVRLGPHSPYPMAMRPFSTPSHEGIARLSRLPCPNGTACPARMALPALLE